MAYPTAFALACLGLGAVLPAAAATFTPPAGCRLEMTVQNRSCTVSQHYRCDGDAPGDQWAEYFSREGATYRSRIDAETRWMESSDLVNGITDRLDGETDPASLTELLATGRDDFDFWTNADDGQRLRHIGRDDLTGETVDIGGVPLQVTRFRLRTFDADGNLLIQRAGQQFVNEENRRFHGGIETATDWTGEVQETNDSPVRFSFPGDPGFGSITPEYDCEVLMTQAGRNHG